MSFDSLLASNDGEFSVNKENTQDLNKSPF